MRFLPLLLFPVILLGCSETTKTTDVVTVQKSSDETQSDSEVPANDPAETTTTPSSEAVSIVIDVRSKEEFDGGHIDDAVHIPHTEIADKIADVTEDKEATIVVYCAAGRRAGIAKTKLEELGYKNVENGGGIDDMKDRAASLE